MYDKLLSSLAFKFNLRHYITERIQGQSDEVHRLTEVGTDEEYSPRHRMPFNSRNESSKCV
jgi:hypothetical protein